MSKYAAAIITWWGCGISRHRFVPLPPRSRSFFAALVRAANPTPHTRTISISLTLTPTAHHPFVHLQGPTRRPRTGTHSSWEARARLLLSREVSSLLPCVSDGLQRAPRLWLRCVRVVCFRDTHAQTHRDKVTLALFHD